MWYIKNGLAVSLTLLSTLAFTTVAQAAEQKGEHGYQTYCAQCHGEQGLGSKKGAKLVGSKLVTGPMNTNIDFILNGSPHKEMPTWRMSPLSDATLAAVITYVRNAWGNNDKAKYGKDAGGDVTAEMIKKQKLKVMYEQVPKQVPKPK